MPGDRISMMLWVLAGVSVLLGILLSFSVSDDAMGQKLAIGAFILMVVAVLIAAMFLFFDPTVFYPKLSPSPR